MVISAILIILFCVYLFCIKGRGGHKDLPELRRWFYAHRGLHKEGVPENSLAAFSAAKNGGYGIELDVHLLKDGSLAVIHDASLKRTAGVDVQIEDLTASDLASYRLEGTDEKIPLFSEVLGLVCGEVPLIVELKPVGNNYAALCEATCRILDDYHGLYCMESFDPRCIAWLRKNRNEIARGQLAYNLFQVNVKIPAVMKFFLQHHILNVATQPDFIAYKYSQRKTLSNFLCRKFWRMQGVIWTVQSEEELRISQQEGWIPIFENINP